MDKMLFMTGENQAEKHQKLIEHLTDEVLGKKEMGMRMSHILQTGEECDLKTDCILNEKPQP